MGNCVPQNKPNIWYVHPYAGGPGIGRYSRPYFLARQWVQAGANATVFTSASHHLLDTPQTMGGRNISGVAYEFIDCRPYSGNGLGRLFNMAEFSAKLRLRANRYEKKYGRPDMVIASSPHPYCFLATHSIARQFGARSVFEVRDLWPLSLVELAGLSPGHPLTRFTAWMERHAYRNADYVVSLLPCTQEYMVEHGLSAKRWRYIPNGVHIDEAAPGAGAASPGLEQARQWRAQGKIVVAYTGALGQPNYVESLIEAISTLHANGESTICAVIVGRGERQQTLLQLVHDRGLQDRITIHDQIAKRDVLALLQEVDIGYISLKPESLFRFGVSPNKLFDYMLAALPILFAVRTGNDPVTEAACGVSADPGNATGIADGLMQLARLGTEERRAAGERGRAYVLRQHTYDVLASDYLTLCRYEE